jgi:hypothetical protein
MSENISVIAVFNTIKDVKPLWLLRDGKKYKVDQVLSSFESHGLMVFHCMIAGEHVALHYYVDNHQWVIG